MSNLSSNFDPRDFQLGMNHLSKEINDMKDSYSLFGTLSCVKVEMPVAVFSVNTSPTVKSLLAEALEAIFRIPKTILVLFEK